MHSNTKKMRCLVVEDDEFKLDSVVALVEDELGEGVNIVSCDALSTAIRTLNTEKFDLVVIDMSIPSHPVSAGAGSPYSLPSGGLDVLFEIDALGHRSTSIILTQYPEIEIDGVLVPVETAANEIVSKFDICVAACIQYFEDSIDWKVKILNIIRTL